MSRLIKKLETNEVNDALLRLDEMVDKQRTNQNVMASRATEYTSAINQWIDRLTYLNGQVVYYISYLKQLKAMPTYVS